MSIENIKILQCGGGWPTNIGNAFIDIGAHYSIKKVRPNSKVYLASSLSPWFYYNYGKPQRFGLIKNVLEWRDLVQKLIVERSNNTRGLLKLRQKWEILS